MAASQEVEKRRLGALAQRAASDHAVREDWRGIFHPAVSSRRSDFLRSKFQRLKSAESILLSNSCEMTVKVWAGNLLFTRQTLTADGLIESKSAAALVPPNASMTS